MKVSVAMATYNGASYIKEQLASVLNQTRTVDEVIICDDRSKDNTAAIVKEFIGYLGCSMCIR
jgi:glycosyltransferase involved in cell wall biosynthesis